VVAPGDAARQSSAAMAGAGLRRCRVARMSKF
jgi:hypothetical protein